jgi:hypothetical protein
MHPDSDLAEPPGQWATLPDPPGPMNPDPPGAGRDEPSGAGGGSASPSPPALTPASFKSKQSAYSAIARALFVSIGGYLNMLLAIDDNDETWLPDGDDQEAIPPPLGRLAARRIPLGDLADNWSDLQDLGMLAVGLAAYAAKGVTGWANGRRERRRRNSASVTSIAPDLPPG